MLIHIAAGVSHLNCKPFSAIDSNAKEHGKHVEDWIADMTKTMRQVGAAINASDKPKSS